VSSIKDKLRALERGETSRTTVRRRKKIRRTGSVPELDAFFLENKYGTCLVREKKFAISHVHGVKLGDFLNLSGDLLSLIGKDMDLVRLSPEEVVFLDTETTGLAGGTGTYIFLMGLGTFEKDFFRVRQVLMTDYSQEPAFLHEISSVLEKKKGIVSYNGKSYDIPLLQTRLTINRMNFSPDRLAHLDLLFTSRRLWRRAMGSCRLTDVEHHVLGFRRENDIPGSEIPDLFFEFLKTENYDLIKPVCQHNAMDIVSMVSIAVKAHQAFATRAEPRTTGYDIFGVVKTLEDLGMYERASDSITGFIDRSDEKETDKLLLRKAGQMKKMGRFEEAEEIWREVIARSREFPIEAYLELAKCYEHRTRKIDAALAVVDKAVKRLTISSELHHSYEREKELAAFRHRRDRLLRKKSRSEATKGKCNQHKTF
jgi:uncharacterized protein YprB with RNaseH-like and TPR domain